MYENITYEVILQRMIDKVIEGNPHVDTREGSIVYNALAPAAVELQNMYIEFDWMLNQSFADTASREYLIKRAAERGIEPEKATNAILEGVFDADIPFGSRFSLDKLNYVVTDFISIDENQEIRTYELMCETVGEVGNQQFGTLIPIDYIDGLTTAELTSVLIPGEDEEATEVLRKRYFNSFETNPYGGNKQDYIQKTNTIAGVGSTKVTPTWKGGGTVKVTILDAEFNKASTTLINTVQTILDPVSNQGEGLGVAPIGHVVTVDTATEVVVNVASTITFATGYNWDNIKNEAIALINDYLLEIRKDWMNQTISYVRIAQIERSLLSIIGVVDITGTTINSLAENLELNEYQIPILGGVTV
jgi:uncharacterized phage protein gp47/JayE